MTLLHVYDGSPIVNLVKLQDETAGYSASAQLGQPDIIRVLVDDPSASYDFTGHKRWRMIEDACPAGSMTVWRGWVGEQTITRAPGVLTSTARRWELELIEDNTALVRRVLGWTSQDVVDTSADRPSETVSTRITWLLTRPGFSGIIYDRGLVASSSVVLDATDYTNRTGGDVLQDCALATGWNYHVRYHESTDTLELIFLDFLTSASDLATLSISNVLGDLTSTVVAPFRDGALHRRPARIASGVALPYSGGMTYRTNAGTAAAFTSVDQVAPTANVDTAATAVTLADRLLTQHSVQEEEVTGLRLLLNDEQLNTIKVGQRLDVRMSHWPNWTTARPVRVTRRSFARPQNMSQDVYEVTLDLKPATVPTPSHARAMRPNDNYSLGSLTWKLGWDYDGDNPQPGDPADASYGLLTYYPVGAKPANGWEGLIAQGSGILTSLSVRASALGVANGSTSMTITIRVNATVVGTATDSDATAGLHAQGYDTTATASNIAVANGDIITGQVTFGGVWSADPAIPSGVGNSSHHLYATGGLA